MLKAASFACLMLLVSAATLRAQQPSQSLAELPSRVEKGDRVKVVMRDGMVINGRFDSVTNSTIRLGSGRSAREYAATMVQEVRKQRPDSLKNGMLYGALAGIGAGFAVAGASCPNDPECAAYTTLAFVPIFTGGGIAVGAIIDSSTHKYDSVYIQQAVNYPRLRISPVASRDRKGIRIALSF